MACRIVKPTFFFRELWGQTLEKSNECRVDCFQRDSIGRLKNNRGCGDADPNMTIDMFWSLVERVHAGAPDDMKEKCRLLAAELRTLSCEELISFDEHFRDLFYQAYNWELWAAAYIIERGGCSDDSFMDFRSTLISLGRAAYETALRDVDSLADFNINPAWATYEGYQYVAPEVYEEKGCPPDGRLRDARPAKLHPKKPTGRDWQDCDLEERYPRLAEKYGWEKRDWSKQKEVHAKFLDHMAKGRELAQLMLDTCIIPSCGLIPPPRIVREVLHSGRSPFPAATLQTWQPFDLDEGHYWIAARELKQPSAEALKHRADLTDVALAVDTEAPSATTYAEWLDSLKARGLNRV
jgi:hypothetical protein